MPYRSVNRVLVAARRHPLPNTVSLAVFGVLIALAPVVGSANSHTDQADTADTAETLDLTRIDEAASCTRYGINRIVELRVSGDGQAPCEVAYLKPDEGQATTSLWRAQNDYGYCVLKFNEFIAKLKYKLLWDCGTDGESSATVSAVTSVPQDASLAVADAVEAPEAAVEASREVSEVVEAVGDDDLRLAEQASLDVPQVDLRKEVPLLAAAVVTTRRDNDGPGAAVSMDDVRSRIPSGPYEAIVIAGTDASACPPGGSFFWNTRDPDQPVFEMGQDAEFTFSTARGRVGQGFALQAEPTLLIERDDPSGYKVASLSVVGAGTVEARIRTTEETASKSGESICQYSLGGG